jgi:putative membrane protein
MTKLKNIYIIAVASLVALSATPLRAASTEATEKQRGQLSRDDYKFACEAARGGMYEVKAGELAQQQGQDPSIRQFGARMVADHRKADEQLKSIATQKGATLPTRLTRKEQDLLDGLSKLSGKDFDRAYAENMVKDHKTDLKEFQKESQQTEDQDLKTFAKTTAGAISEHLAAAKRMEAIVDRESNTAQQ